MSADVKSLKAQVEYDDEAIRKVIAVAEDVSGFKCFLRWETFVELVLRGELEQWLTVNPEVTP